MKYGAQVDVLRQIPGLEQANLPALADSPKYLSQLSDFIGCANAAQISAQYPFCRSNYGG